MNFQYRERAVNPDARQVPAKGQPTDGLDCDTLGIEAVPDADR